MATQTGQPGDVAESYGHTGRKVFSIFMIVSPLILPAATIVHPAHGIAATDGAEYFGAAYNHTTRFYIAHTGYFLTGVTLIVAFIGIEPAGAAHHPEAAFWGLVLPAMGFVGWGAIDGMDFMTWNAGRFSAAPASTLDYNTMQTYIDDALGDQAVLIPVFGVFALLLIGLVVNAVGLHRAGMVNFFHALLLPIGVGGVISFLDYPPLDRPRPLRVRRRHPLRGATAPDARRGGTAGGVDVMRPRMGPAAQANCSRSWTAC
jgi:hypothetical protein